MNHAKPTDPDEMYGTNETKKLRGRKGRGRTMAGMHGCLPPSGSRPSLAGFSRETHSNIYPALVRLENTSKLTAPYTLPLAVDS